FSRVLYTSFTSLVYTLSLHDALPIWLHTRGFIQYIQSSMAGCPTRRQHIEKHSIRSAFLLFSIVVLAELIRCQSMLAIMALHDIAEFDRPVYISGIQMFPRIFRIPPHFVKRVLPFRNIIFTDEAGTPHDSLLRGCPARLRCISGAFRHCFFIKCAYTEKIIIGGLPHFDSSCKGRSAISRFYLCMADQIQSVQTILFLCCVERFSPAFEDPLAFQGFIQLRRCQICCFIQFQELEIGAAPPDIHGI